MATVQTTIIQKSRFEDFRMSETRANHGYLETDIDEFLDQTPPEAQSLFNAGSKLSFQHDRDNGTNGISKSIVLTENSDTKPGPEDISADTPLVDSDKDEPLTSSASPFLQDNPRTESYVSDGNSEVNEDYDKGRRRLESTEILTTILLCLGVSMSCLFLFLLVTSLISAYWEPNNLRKFCDDIHVVGYTSQACRDIDSG
ncbi:uncharacterized protein LOC117336178 isoform X1 [Pecten maximus]|uniref:uncharacterized protein LOC117336178 isoform X1 n=1 Tax=Pecten maximus TaxID=6579 RepID=UPI001458DBD9|nr:uncharacterized protein LOC117336178 isoform X1 [Pecten maximus]